MAHVAPRMGNASTMHPTDTQFLHHAIRIGMRHLGRTWPNPSVGCVLVKDGQVIATAATAETGRPHAETQALEQAGERARGATAYVTLEPCAHHGVTPPCARALIAAGIARVVIGAHDHDPRVAGKGSAMLREAGIAVDDLELPNAAALHRGFFRRVRHGLPEVLMKLATSADGHMADPAAQQRWITGETARMHGHTLRNQVDAVLTGIGTVLADDPLLTVRLPGVRHERLVRVVADRSLRTPLECQLVRTAEQQASWIITTPEGVERAASHATDLRERGVKLLVLEGDLTAEQLARCLTSEGITRVLVEGGPKLSTAFLKARLVDRLYWYRSTQLLGKAGQPAIGALDSALINAAERRGHRILPLAADTCELIEYRSCLPD